MLLITQNTTNNLFLSFNGKKQSDTNQYLIQFIDNLSNEYVYTITTDVSPTYRYNEFCVKETGSNAIPQSGSITLSLPGFYFYNIFENPSASLDPTGLNQVETGKALVLSQSGSAPVITYTSSINPDLVVYDPNQYNN